MRLARKVAKTARSLPCPNACDSMARCSVFLHAAEWICKPRAKRSLVEFTTNNNRDAVKENVKDRAMSEWIKS